MCGYDIVVFVAITFNCGFHQAQNPVAEIFSILGILFRLARVVSQFPAQYFDKLPGFNLWKLTRLSGFFPPFVSHFFKQAREGEVKLRHVVYEVWLVSYIFFSFQVWYFRTWITTSIGQSKRMRVTRFNPLWVSGCTRHYTTIVSVAQYYFRRKCKTAAMVFHKHWIHVVLWPHYRVYTQVLSVLFANLVHVRIATGYFTVKLIAR